MRTKLVNISDLKLAKYNPRQISEHDMASLVNSIREFGIVEPIVVNKNNIVIGGHQRLVACQQLSIEKVPVVYVDLPKKKEKILNLVLNRIHGDWDLVKLSVVLEELKLGNGDEIGLTGFEMGEIDEIIDSQIPEDEREDNFDGQTEAAKIKKAISKRGKVYQLGRHRLMCGDATVKADVEKLMDGKKADMVFTDPPYGIDYDDNQWEKIRGYDIKSKRMGRIEGDSKPFDPSFLLKIFSGVKEIFVWGFQYFPDKLGRGGIVAWIKKTDAQKNMLHGDFELCWSKSERNKMFLFPWGGFNNKERSEGERFHPTQKPVGIISLFLKQWGNDEDVVVDPFGGSGSTLIACEQLNRKCFMMEIDPVYCDVIQKRYKEYVEKEEKSIAQNGAKSAVGA